MWVVCLKPLPSYALERAHDTNSTGARWAPQPFLAFCRKKNLLSLTKFEPLTSWP
jgi:hypothetical protein